eukprot:m51a1_g2177 putative general transcription factor iih subunit 4 (926) ;mRNA; f:84387-91130
MEGLTPDSLQLIFERLPLADCFSLSSACRRLRLAFLEHPLLCLTPYAAATPTPAFWRTASLEDVRRITAEFRPTSLATRLAQRSVEAATSEDLKEHCTLDELAAALCPAGPRSEQSASFADAVSTLWPAFASGSDVVRAIARRLHAVCACARAAGTAVAAARAEHCAANLARVLHRLLAPVGRIAMRPLCDDAGAMALVAVLAEHCLARLWPSSRHAVGIVRAAAERASSWWPMGVAVAVSAAAPCAPARKMRAPLDDACAWWRRHDARAVAEALTAYEHALLARLDPCELVLVRGVRRRGCDDAGPEAAEPPGSVRKQLIDRFNALNYCVAWSIVSPRDVRERAEAVSRAVAVARELRALSNFQQMASVVCALSRSAVTRLRMTWAEPELKSEHLKPEPHAASAPPLAHARATRGHTGVDGLLDAVAGLPAALQARLYADPSSARAVFASLPALEQSLVLRLLHVAEPLRASVALPTPSAGPEGPQRLDGAVARLCALGMLAASSDDGAAEPALCLTEPLRQRLLADVLGEGEAAEEEEDGGGGDEEGRPRTVEHTAQVEAAGSAAFDAILGTPLGVPRAGYLARGAAEEPVSGVDADYLAMMSGAAVHATVDPPQHVIDVLVASGLLDAQTRRLTPAGFGFLLGSRRDQLWGLLLRFARGSDGSSSAAARERECETLCAILRVCHCEPRARGYSTARMSQRERETLAQLQGFGVVAVQRGGGAFHPSALAKELWGGSSSLVADPADVAAVCAPAQSAAVSAGNRQRVRSKGFIIVESNSRVYAYTGSAIQITLLELFVSPIHKMPGFFSGEITRESVQKAVSRGIKASQMIAFLMHNAHPVVSGDGMPDTIKDQIKLFAKERTRLSMAPAVLYRFATAEAYARAKQLARSSGAMLWSSRSEPWLAVDPAATPAINALISSLRT